MHPVPFPAQRAQEGSRYVVCLHTCVALDRPGAKRRSLLGHEVIPGFAPRVPVLFHSSLFLRFWWAWHLPGPHRDVPPALTHSHCVLGSVCLASAAARSGRCVVIRASPPPPHCTSAQSFLSQLRFSSDGPGPTWGRGASGLSVAPLTYSLRGSCVSWLAPGP